MGMWDGSCFGCMSREVVTGVGYRPVNLIRMLCLDEVVVSYYIQYGNRAGLVFYGLFLSRYNL